MELATPFYQLRRLKSIQKKTRQSAKALRRNAVTDPTRLVSISLRIHVPTVLKQSSMRGAASSNISFRLKASTIADVSRLRLSVISKMHSANVLSFATPKELRAPPVRLAFR